MTRRMYDSTDVADIPRTAKMVAGYVDGRYRTVDQLRARFPKAQVVTITVTGEQDAHVCDTEPGNVGLAGAARWAKRQVDAGKRPTLYCMASQWPQLRAEVKRLGIAHAVSYWIAQYDGKAQVPRGAVAKQYADPRLSGGHYDVSVVDDYWPGVDPPLPSDLSRVSALLARRLSRRLQRRQHRPVRNGRQVLKSLGNEIDRVLGLR